MRTYRLQTLLLPLLIASCATPQPPTPATVELRPQPPAPELMAEVPSSQSYTTRVAPLLQSAQDYYSRLSAWQANSLKTLNDSPSK